MASRGSVGKLGCIGYKYLLCGVVSKGGCSGLGIMYSLSKGCNEGVGAVGCIVYVFSLVYMCDGNKE